MPDTHLEPCKVRSPCRSCRNDATLHPGTPGSAAARPPRPTGQSVLPGFDRPPDWPIHASHALNDPPGVRPRDDGALAFDAGAFEAWAIIQQGRAQVTTKKCLTRIRYMVHEGLSLEALEDGPQGAMEEGTRWLMQRVHGGQRAPGLREYQKTLNWLLGYYSHHLDPAYAACRFRLTKPNRPYHRYFHEQELQAIARHRSQHAFLDARRRALSWICHHTGLRRGEVAGLTIQDIHPYEDAYLVLENPEKDGPPRLLPLPDDATEVRGALQTYLQYRAQVLRVPGCPSDASPPAARDALWIGIGSKGIGRPLTGAGLAQDFGAITRDLGFPVNFTRYRHSFATRLTAAGVNLRSIQYLLGHATPASTARYAATTYHHVRDELHDRRLDGFQDPKT